MRNKSESTTWNVADIRKYAIQKYNLEEGFNINGISAKDNYDKTIRRTLKVNGFVKRNKKTNKYEYIVPEHIGKMLVDSIMHDYFVERSNEEASKKAFIKMDIELNTKHQELEESIATELAEYGELSPYLDMDKIESDIDRFMLRALFSIYFDFDKTSYLKDQEELLSLYNEYDNREPYLDGYSRIKYKLDNPIDFYCKRK